MPQGSWPDFVTAVDRRRHNDWQVVTVVTSRVCGSLTPEAFLVGLLGRHGQPMFIRHTEYN